MPRFRLRTFLIAITLFCLLLGWRISAVERVERPIRELEKLGWTVEYIGYPNPYSGPVLPRPYWRKILSGYHEDDWPRYVWWGTPTNPNGSTELPRIVQESATNINRLPTITAVDLSRAQLDNESLIPPSRCKNVSLLRLDATGLDDSAIDHLAKLTQLESLSLWNTNLTAEGAAELEQRLPNCEIDHDFNDD